MAYIVPEEYIHKLLCLIRNVVMGYFEEGEMPIEQAYAYLAIAEAYLERITGDDKFGNLIEEYEANEDQGFIIFPTDKVLEKLAFDICSTEDFVQENETVRDILTSIDITYNAKQPKLKLIKPRHGH